MRYSHTTSHKKTNQNNLNVVKACQPYLIFQKKNKIVTIINFEILFNKLY